MEENIDPKLVEKLILLGAVEVSGIDEDGGLTYKFTPSAKDLVPDLYNSYMNNFYSSLMTLWEKGFLNMDITDINPVVTVKRSKLDDEIALADLTDEERKSLDFVITVMKDK